MSKLELVVMAGAETKQTLAAFKETLDRAEALIERLEAINLGEAEVATTTKGKGKASATTTKQADKVKKAAAEVEETEDDTLEGADDAEGDDLDFLDEEAEEIVKAPEIADVRAAVKEFANVHGKEKCVAFLKKFGASAIPELKKKDYAKVIELAKKHSKKK